MKWDFRVLDVTDNLHSVLKPFDTSLSDTGLPRLSVINTSNHDEGDDIIIIVMIVYVIIIMIINLYSPALVKLRPKALNKCDYYYY